jgi:hypothetical protein
MQKSVVGIVSRVSPVHTALRNCTRDEGRYFEVGNQVLISSHRKLPLSKAMVVVEPLHFLRTAAANGHRRAYAAKGQVERVARPSPIFRIRMVISAGAGDEGYCSQRRHDGLLQ